MSIFWSLRGALDETADRPAIPGRAPTVVDDRVDRALLACEAMWSLLRDKLGLTDDDLVHRFNDLDLSDGKLDGKVRKSAVSCPKCGKAISRRIAKCMYCGQPIAHDPFA